MFVFQLLEMSDVALYESELSSLNHRGESFSLSSEQRGGQHAYVRDDPISDPAGNSSNKVKLNCLRIIKNK